MARTTKSLSGGGKDKFFRGVVATVEGIDPLTADTVAEALSDTVTEVRVRREVWESLRDGPDLELVAVPTPPVKAEAQPAAAPVAISPAPVATVAPFDPYAFSAIAVFTRNGAAGLTAELDRIGSVGDLQALASAQHLSVDPAVTDPAAIRAAILAGVERRIADRKAAAS